MRNLTMLTDFYQLTMMNGYADSNMADKEAVFDIFFRTAGSVDFAVVAGLEQAIEYINNLYFTEDDITYLRGLNQFNEKFFERIVDFKFTGDIRAMREGDIVFPFEPILSVRAPLFQAQLLETALLNIINHQTLIATKSFKITQEAVGGVLEFGLRRAQGPDAGIYGSRASIIGGCVATSNVLAGKMFDIKVSGTHAHSWVMSFDSEIESFRAYARVFPTNCLLLVDTYDTLRSGVPNAITVFNELRATGIEPIGIRLDSGDLAYLSKKARVMLDEAGYPNAKIFASGDIDEYVLNALKSQGAKIDVWGIGTKLITASPHPALGGVYKLAAIKNGDIWVPKMKVSDTFEKITNPGIKTTYRIYNSEGMAEADIITLADEVIDTSKDLTIFHPLETWKIKTFTTYTIRNLLVTVFKDGVQVYQSPTLAEIAKYAKERRDEFYDEYKRLISPHIYKVDLSEKLYLLRQQLLKSSRG